VAQGRGHRRRPRLRLIEVDPCRGAMLPGARRIFLRGREDRKGLIGVEWDRKGIATWARPMHPSAIHFRGNRARLSQLPRHRGGCDENAADLLCDWLGVADFRD
jgi:hypothetical protein